MKSYVSYLQGLFHDILTDVCETYPYLHKDLERDHSRLLSLVESRGLSFFTIDLPALGKHFDVSLDEGRLRPSLLPGGRCVGRSPIPCLYKGMVLRVFNHSGELRVDADNISVRFLRQLYYMAKKLKLECSDGRTYESVRQYFDIDDKLRRPTYRWDDDYEPFDTDPRVDFGFCYRSGGRRQGDLHFAENVPPVSLAARTTLQRVCDVVSADLGLFRGSDWRSKHGPGAVADQNGKKSKYDFPTWPAKLENVFPLADFAYANFGLWADELIDGEIGHRFAAESPSRLIAVPKTQKGPRLIAAEPVAHQWCQQSILDYFNHRIPRSLLSSCINLRDQSLNQEAAREASLTGSSWTVDLSAASDRLSCWVVERVFRRNKSLLAALHATRTRYITNVIDRKSPRLHRLKKFASMGSATTFPVQSVVFACVVIASVLSGRGSTPTTNNIRRAAKQVRIFGDDIVIPSDVGGTLLELLDYLDFQVNPHKTYRGQGFRESCGLDAFRGHNVTPSYILAIPVRARPESMISSVSSHNNFIRSGYVTAGARIEKTIRKQGLNLPYVEVGSEMFAFEALGGSDYSGVKTRWNEHLHRREYRIRVPRGTPKRHSERHGARLLQYFTEAPTPLVQWRSGSVVRLSADVKLRWQWVNHER